MVLRHVSILKDHPQGVCLYLAKFCTVICNFYPTLFGQNTFTNIPIDAQQKSSGVDNNQTSSLHLVSVA